MVGVDKIFLYNNGHKIVDSQFPSGDNKIWGKKRYAEYNTSFSNAEIDFKVESTCKKYNNRVVLKNWRYGIEAGPYPASQVTGYKNCVENNKSDWWLFIDIDEFIISKNFNTIPEFLLNQNTNKYGAFVLGQKIFKQRGTGSVRHILNCNKSYCKQSNYGFTKTLISYPIVTYKTHQPAPGVGEIKFVNHEDLMYYHYRGHNKKNINSEQLEKINLPSKDDSMLSFLKKHNLKFNSYED
jgi:hypothetical protein